MSINPRSFKDQATLPCIMLPPSKSPKSFDRDDVIEKIENHFNKRSTQTFRSIALYGIGGAGKTHVAIKYAQARYKQHKINAVLWVEAETKIKVKQSFSDIAGRLQLPGYVPHNHDDNRLLVMTWLQQTMLKNVGDNKLMIQIQIIAEAKWLIVYDNVESFDVLVTHWPNLAANGHALITTRNTDLAWEPAEIGIEVETWDIDNGAKCIIHLLADHISADVLASQFNSALELSERLSGHALALDRMAGVIHKRGWTIGQLVEIYDRAPEFGQNGIGPVWQISFQNLSVNASSILAVISCCSADRIPEMLFQPGEPGKVATELPWCGDVLT
ncbi:hypothetical protein QC764_000320 [Podospora pseudoanserina]|uniref:NB-ARC domain-containing protein n=1 Tax=Podospora pseudoanserina TaxID=2609844 RepID=A0ABR0I949_9PEZI|nr:hypothetical protein QC764_000320 [Podospora pseudoanserina]